MLKEKNDQSRILNPKKKYPAGMKKIKPFWDQIKLRKFVTDLLWKKTWRIFSKWTNEKKNLGTSRRKK